MEHWEEKLRRQLQQKEAALRRYTAEADSLRADNMRLRAEIERLRAAAGGEQGGEGWQDISTAPKGEAILVGRLGSPGMCVFVIENQWWDEAFESGDEPTHWQPLPKPPPNRIRKNT